MSLTTSGISVQFQRTYKESSTRYFDTNWQITAINHAVQDIWDEILNVNPEYAPVKLFQFGYISGQREYVLPASFEQVSKVEVTDLGGPPYVVLFKIRFSDIGVFPAAPVQFTVSGTTIGQGEPQVYYIRFMESGQTPIGQASALTADSWILGLDPIPGRTATNNVNVWYIATAGAVTGIDTTETPDLPPDFHDLIPDHMAVYAAIADESPRLDVYKAIYNDRLLRKLNRVVRGPAINEEVIEVDWLDD
jgi:hypothetical protein